GGFATFFYQGGNAGACGTVHQDSDYVVALQSSMYAGGSRCGKKVKITRNDTGKSITATCADECPTCTNTQSLDLSVAAFTALASESVGMFSITWEFI
ncbi:barwin-like endoglucanase, partial [Violaceomyces palustris]